MSRLEVLKTYKLFVGGQFPRTESGRVYSVKQKNGKLLANVSLASKKDLKNAVVAARSAFVVWSERVAFNRSQIIYRMAEMLEARKMELKAQLVSMGSTKASADKEVNSTIDCLVYYAGWCDKYMQIFSAVNPVSSPHYNFSVPEPMGVVAVIAPETAALLGLVSAMAAVIAGGNTCVVAASYANPLSALLFSEMLATSDLPAGVVNILTGTAEDLHVHMSLHRDVNALLYCGKASKAQIELQRNCAVNVKRFVQWEFAFTAAEVCEPYRIMDFQEIKTTWHPIETTGSSGLKY